MKKTFFLITLSMNLIVHYSWSDDRGHLTAIINKSPYNAVQIQTTDQAASVVLKNGNVWSGSSLQNRKLHLWDLSSFNFTIPKEGWDGEARIYIDVKKNMDDDKTIVSSGQLMERGGQIILKSFMKGRETDQQVKLNPGTNYTLLIDEIGFIALVTQNSFGDWVTTTQNSPPQMTIAFGGYTVPIIVGSPNCSVETDVNKQYIKVDASPAQGEYTMLMKEGCKLVITDTTNNLSATACFGFAQKKDSSGKWIPFQTKEASFFREVGCSQDPECAPDDMTGISPCDKLGISWNEGLDPKTGGLIRNVGPNHWKRFYGITKPN